MVGFGILQGSAWTPQFWEGVDEIFGPILHPIFDPVLTALQDPTFRAYILSSIIWSSIIIATMVYVAYEILPLTRAREAGEATQNLHSSSVKRGVSARIPRGRPSKSGTGDATRADVDAETGETEVESDVRVRCTYKKKFEHIDLFVDVINGSESSIDMVVVDLDLPRGIDADIGSFRMQRLGSIPTGESKVAAFSLQSSGGSVGDIGGYVEFLSSSYEVSKISLPRPEVVSQ
ncbi:MAG: hypothetical protein DRO87_07435 [Candidatus Thorarchaeota archaeon]|nr:MAG: hypothetical protein DRO87_07435 [Candidatus Thorarchaeota archaeon]RLI57149.1 MAG: hypothetical protein DRP09_03880 [Candidatus Thorarchaeota archaeon]